MLFVLYWEMDTAKVKEFVALDKKLANEPLPKGLKPIALYGTPCGWGVDILEAESETAVFEFLSPVMPYFKTIKLSPALPMEKALEVI